MKQCSRVGIPVEQPFSYKVMTFDAVGAQLTLFRMFILCKEKTFLYFDTYRLQIAEDNSSKPP